MANSLKITDLTPPEGFERLVYAEDLSVGLRSYICVHSTKLGPAAGGCRMWPYADDEAAKYDVQRLARGMTYKNCMADLDLGGGKSVIIGNSKTDKTPELFQAFGRAVDSLGGQYYTAEDVGISTEDMAEVAKVTEFAVGLEGGEHGSGDPSPFTAEGVFQCMLVGAENVFGSKELKGKKVLVQGLGHVGMSLAEKVHAHGGELLVADINQAALDHAVANLNATICDPNKVAEQDVDIYAPCALGGVLNPESVAQLKAKLVCGAANNQLATPDVADLLRDKGIRYLPDYVVNAGGIISVAGEIHKGGNEYREQRLAGVASRMQELLERAAATGKTTTDVADEMVEEILSKSS